MTHTNPETRVVPRTAGRRWMERGFLGFSILLIGWFYLWTVSPSGLRALASPQDQSYYNLLVRGFKKGQLALDVVPDPALVASKNPYDPAQRPGPYLHDATLYKGRYFIYFGVTPVVLLYLPFHLMTGHYVTDACTVGLFAFGGFLVSVALFRRIMRMSMPLAPFAVHLAAVWGLGLANMVPPLLRRPAMWEVPIATAYFLFMLTLYLLWRALCSLRPTGWVAAASVSMGLCVGARPTYLPAAVMLLAPLALQGWRLGRRWWREAHWWRQTAAAILPIAAIGLGLALYNYQRFDDPFEFGQKYQLSGANENQVVHFGPQFFSFNLRLYFLAAPGFSPYFPFLTVVHPPPVPPGQLGIEDPYGILPAMPWLALAAAAGLLVRRRDVTTLGLAMTAVGGGLVAGIVLCFAGATGRYQVEFTPTLALLAAVGAAALCDRFPRGEKWLAGLALALATWSSLIGVFLSLQHNRLFRLNHPALYAPVARAFNHVPHWVAKFTGHRGGPVELRLVFPKDKLGKVEPLVVTGREFLADYIYVHYLGPGLVRFGFEHTSYGGWTGPFTRIDPDAEQTLVVQMGSLYPPLEHPVHDMLSPKEREARLRTVKVLLNGRTVLQGSADCYDASEWQPSIGSSGPYRPGFKSDFSGRILSWRRLPPSPEVAPAPKTGKLHLLLKLPAFTGPRSEPLLCTGETGKGDLIYIHYLDATHFQIGHDNWGSGATLTPVVEYDPNQSIDLDISCPPLLAEGAPGRWQVSLNGSVLIDVENPYHPSPPEKIIVGRNAIGASTAQPEFTGVIEIQERAPQ